MKNKIKLLFAFICLLILTTHTLASPWHTWPQIWGKDETTSPSATTNIPRCQQEKLITNANALQIGKDPTDLQNAVTAAQAAGLKIFAQIFANSFPAEQDKQTLIDAGAEVIRYDGTPYYSYGYFCANQPAWRTYLEEVVQVAAATRADGFSLINGNNEDGRCFCASCAAYFRDYLGDNYTAAELAALGIADLSTFDYSDHLHGLGYTNDDIYDDNDKSSIPLLADYKKSNDLAYLSFVNELINLAKTFGRDDIILMNASEGPAEANSIRFTTFEVYSFYTDFDALNTIFSYKENTQAVQFKLDRAMFPSRPIITQPVDLSLGGIVTNTSDPEKYIYGCIAEALANRASYYDVHDFGLWNDVWLDWSIDPNINLKIKDFLQNYNIAFDFNSLESCAKIAILYSSKTQLEAQRLRPATAKESFVGLGKALSKAGFQYDVIVNSDGQLQTEIISASLLSPYEIVILPGTYSLTAQERSALLSYANSGGTLIAYGEIDSNLSLTPGETTYGSGKIYYDTTSVPKSYAQTAATTYLATIESNVTNYLSSKIVRGIAQTHINRQVWKTADPERLYLHLVNHDIANTEADLAITLELPANFGPDILYLVSPDLSEQEIPYTENSSSISFTVPELDVWNMLILTSTQEAQAAAEQASIINSMACGPNPATATSTIIYNIAEPAAIKIRIYSINGDLIKVLTDTYSLADAARSITWDLNDAFSRQVANGVYIYVMEAIGVSGKKSTQRGKILVLK
ncbi:MAG: T9SS type A sorting domain-containing protein [Candidatus Margulisiibacteriota bacterium]